jgi:hypothetical protein
MEYSLGDEAVQGCGKTLPRWFAGAGNLTLRSYPGKIPEILWKMRGGRVPGTSAEEWRIWILALVLLTVLPGAGAADTGQNKCPQELALAIPGRPAGSASGSEVASKAGHLGQADRETLLQQELFAGNIPRFLRRLVPVTLSGTGAGGRPLDVTFCVAPDYVAVGSDRDFLRVPMGLDTALSVATRFGFVLPTRAMVDAIYAQSTAHLDPKPMKPGAQMTSTEYYVRHNRDIDLQRSAKGLPLGVLLTGHKKDLVLTDRLRRKRGRVAIYGWHRSGGRPIQPLSTVHGATYADYSHGIRLVSATVFVNGEPMSIFDALEDPSLAGLLSDEGPIPGTAELVVENGGRGALLRTANARVPARRQDS